MRKKKSALGDKGAGQVSNPQRSNKAAREKRREQYDYELAQYNYYNQRKRVVNQVMNADTPKHCGISIRKIEEHFKSTLEVPNSNVRREYGTARPRPNLVEVKLQSIHKALKSTSLDTSPGPDGVLARTIKTLDVSHIIKNILDIMLKFGYVPEPLRKGRTILIYKGKGDVNNISSWRPITIYSIVRRIIEKVLDFELRLQVSFHPSQRGFIMGLPGCHVNTRIIDAILRDAKVKRKDCAVSFLDVTGAFDNVGHGHVMSTLESKGVSEDLRKVIGSLLQHNTITIRSGLHSTQPIEVRRGVPQGGPLSATLFNASVDHVYDEVCDPALANEFGYKLSEEMDGCILSGFADDKGVTAKNKNSAERIVNLISRILKEVGLHVNPIKSTALILEEGELVNANLELESGDTISSIGPDETVRYLGCSFAGELVVNENAISKFHQNVNKLTSSNLLKPEQKLNIINQYLFPSLTYQLQSAPLTKLQPSLLEGLDVIIRRSVKAMLGLPASSSSAMFYAPKKCRGLCLLRCAWEAPLQHMAIAKKLKQVSDAHFQSTFKYEAEIQECAARLSLENLEVDNVNVKRIRQELREKSFEEWSSCRWQGIGVGHFRENTKANKFMTDRTILSGSEWTNALKLNINYAPLRGVPGVSGAADCGSLCRRCGKEPETPAHVLGSCPHSMLLVTRRHHNVKHFIIKLLEERDYRCHEEVYCIDADGRPRYADIVAFSKSEKRAFVLDPTIRFETNDVNQAQAVDEEKKKIYEGCIPYLKERFLAEYGEREYSVHGLWFGSRGAIPSLTKETLNILKVDLSSLLKLVELIILDSLGILHNHIYKG